MSPGQVTDVNSDCRIGEGDQSTGLRSDARVTVAPNSADAAACAPLPAVVVPAPSGGQGDSSTTSSSTTTTTTTAPGSTTTTIPVDQQIEALVAEFGTLYEDAIPVLVNLHADHLADVANGGAGFFDAVEQEVMDLAAERMDPGIRASELNDARLGLTSRPPPLFVAGLDAENAGHPQRGRSHRGRPLAGGQRDRGPGRHRAGP